MSDDFEPSISMDATDSGSEAAPIERAATAAPEPVADPDAGPRGQRVVSERVREMMKTLAKTAAESGGIDADELQPMEHDAPASPPPAAAAAAVEPPPSPPVEVPAAPAAAAAAPEPQIDVAKLAAEQAKIIVEEREKSYAEREAKLVEREKRLPDSEAWVERPGATAMAMLKEALGGASDAEMRDAVEDLVTELSEQVLGVQLPADLKRTLESRKAVRSVKAYKADLTRQQQRIQEERAAAERAAREEADRAAQARNEAEAYRHVAGVVASTKDQYKFLHEEGDDPASIVFAIVKEQVARKEQPNIEKAAKFADDYFRKQAESVIKKSERLKSLLTPPAPAAAPAAAPAPAPAVKSPGGAPGPAPTTQAKPAPAPARDDEPLAYVDWRDQRRANARKLAARVAKT